MTVPRRSASLLAVLTSVVAFAVACTGDSDDNEQDDAAIEICEDFSFVPCPRQTAIVALPLTGSRFSLVYASDRVPGRKAAAVLPAQDLGLAGWSLDVLHSYDTDQHVLVMGDGTRRHADAVPLETGDAALGVGSVNGAEVYLFDDSGRQLATLDAVTGARLLTFAWGKHGLVSLTESGDRKTTVVRDGRGDLIGIVSDRGYRTRFGARDGWLAATADETGNLTRIATGEDGLVTGIVPAEGGSTRFEYDDDGRLINVAGPGARELSMARRDVDGGFEVTLTTAAKRAEVMRVQRKGDDVMRMFVDSAGLTSKVTAAGDHRRVKTADGTTIVLDLADDPMWGASAPVIAKAVTTTAGGRNQTVHERRTSEASEPTVEPTGVARSLKVDGATWKTTFDPAARQVQLLDPSGLSRTTTLDEAGRPVTVETSGAAARTYQYSARGAIKTMTVGAGAEARVWRYGYDTSTGSVAVTDPVGAVTSVSNDANGRAQQISASGAGTLSLDRDALGRFVGVIAPSGATWGTLYGAAGDVDVTTRPAGTAGPSFTSFERDADGALNARVVPGVDELSVGRDEAGRPTRIQLGDTEWATTYAATGAVDRIEGHGVALEIDVDNGAVVGERWSGPFDARVDRKLDGQGRLASVAVNEGDAVRYQYDAAGRVRRAGALEVTRDAKTGRVAEEHIGALVRRWEYNGFGEVIAITVEVAGRSAQSLTIERDGLGRVVRRTEVDRGGPRTTTYGYDKAGRLASTVVDGGPRTTFAYDANGNVTRERRSGGSVVASRFGSDDTLVRRGNALYKYDRAGRLATMTTPAGKTSYGYDILGNLLSVTGPSATKTTYVVDGAGRRIAREGGSGPGRGFVYLDGTRPAGMLDEDGRLLSSFVYSGGSPAPTYVAEQGGRTLFVVTDDIGSPRALVDVKTGATVWHLRTDELGRVESRTDFAQFPFGFAGGLADPGTSLVRFGARDYDPEAARWTAPDPIGYGGGDANLYRYVGGDPVNRVDPSGLEPIEPAAPGVSSWGANGIVLGGSESPGPPAGEPSWGANGIVLGGSELPGPSAGEPSWGANGIVLGGSELPGPSAGEPSWGANGIVLDDVRPVYAEPQWGENGIVLGEIEPSSLVPVWGENGIVVPTTPDVSPLDVGGGTDPGADAPAVSNGDPHLRTLDGVIYNLQNAGEFTALKSDSGDLVVQVRHEIRAPVRWVTWTTAVAVEVLGDRLTFEATRSGWNVRLDGVPIAKESRDLPGGGQVLLDLSGYSVIWPDGTTVRFLGSPPGEIDFQVIAASSRVGTLHGLLGPFTGEEDAADLETADGTNLDLLARADNDRLYHDFGDSWRISQKESRFDYRTGESTATFTDHSIPDFSAAVQATQTAKAVCRATGLADELLAACALDVTVTGDAGYALRTRRAFATPPGNADRPSAAPAATGIVFHIAAGDTVAKGRPGAGAGDVTKPREQDVYELDGKAGTAVLLRAAESCQGGNGLVWTVRGPAGSRVIESQQICVDLGLTEFDLDGTYRILVSGENGAVGTYGFSVVSASTGSHDIGPGATVSGRVSEPGGKRTYRLEMSSGTVVYLRAGDTSCGRLVWQVVGPTGSLVNTNRDICSDLGRTAADVDGTYTITVISQGNGSGDFDFEVVRSVPDKVARISVGDTISGRLSAPGARAEYRLEGRKGQVVAIRTVLPCAQRLEWIVRGPVGSAVNTSTATCSDLGSFTFDMDATYTISVLGSGDGVGDYKFTVEPG